MIRRLTFCMVAVLAIGACSDQQEPNTTAPSEPEVAAAKAGGTVGVNIVLNTNPTAKILAELARYGTAVEAIPQINGVTLNATADKISAIRKLAYVKKAGRDITVTGSPVDAVAATNFLNGLSTWDQDGINATVNPFSAARGVTQTGNGVYVGVLDTGLLDTWRQYFPQERIATQYAKSFGSGNSVPEQPNKWEHDVNGHGTHVTSTIIGYSFFGTPFNGTAPLATIIPVKVLGQTGSGSSAAVARGIVYISELKVGPLAGSPMVINMSLGGPEPDPLTEAAIDLAVSRGVIIVASAGNSGPDGIMGWPGAFPKVISVASAGWVGEWRVCGSNALDVDGIWWFACNVPETNDPINFYISDFSSRESSDASLKQDLDIAAPGSWVVGPFQLNRGKISYFFLGGTSMASPHVAGIVALMAQKKPTLTAAEAETIIESSALPLGVGPRTITNPDGTTSVINWGSDATGAGLARADVALSLIP